MLAPYVSRKSLAIGGCLAVLSGVLVATASADPGGARQLVAASEAARTPLPAGSTDRGRAGLERTALELAATLDAVPVREGGPEADRYCAPSSLRVEWAAPTTAYAVGAHLDPVGPAPDDSTTAVNGVVVCADADYAYMGFEARWAGERWDVAAVPALSDEHELHEEESHADDPAAAAPAAPVPAPSSAPARPSAGGTLGQLGPSAVGGVDPYARYDPQRVCDPVAKPGTTALRDMLLRTYGNTRSLGVSRTCTARGVSEHKEGRAFDWGVNAGIPAQRASAESALSQLLATDAAGNRHALARRLGVMYLIWDRKIWSAYNASAGWRPYSGASPHTDHVHISLSWDGAMGRTSFWQGSNASLLRLDPNLQLAWPTASVAGVGTGGSGTGGAGGAVAAVPVAATGGSGERRRSHPRSDSRPDGATHSRPDSRRDGRPGSWTDGWTGLSGGPADGESATREERSRHRQALGEGRRREKHARAAAEAAARAAAELAAQTAAAEAAAQAADQADAEAAARARADERARAKAAAQAAAAAPSGRGGGKGSRRSGSTAPVAPSAPQPVATRSGGGDRSKGAGSGRGGGQTRGARGGKVESRATAPSGGGGGSAQGHGSGRGGGGGGGKGGGPGRGSGGKGGGKGK